MAKQDEILKNIIQSIEESINGLSNALPVIQQNTLDSLVTMLKELETDKGGNIKASVNNLKLIAKIKGRLEGIILNADYVKALHKYMAGFNQVTKLQNDYFSTLAKEYKPNALLSEIKKQSVDTTLQSLSEKGIGGAVVSKIGEILNRNVTSGAKYSDLIKTVTDAVINNATGAGLLERHVKPLATDAINQYSATYTHAVAADLGLEWFMYDGVIIDTSRDFCIALVKKKYYHISELADIIRGNFEEFKDIEGKISPKTKLPEGMYAETTVENFNTLRGGHQCNHQVIPVSEAVVPQAIKDAINRKVAIEKPAKRRKRKLPPALKDYPVELNPDALKGLTKKVKFDIGEGKDGTYYLPYYKQIVINQNGRFWASKWLQENVMYHEAAHATHNEHGIINSRFVRDDFENLFSSLRKKIADRESDIEEDLYMRLNRVSLTADDKEMILSALDVLGSLTGGKYGQGHQIDYYNNDNGKYKEVFAHGAQLLYSRNKHFEEVMPDVVEELRKYMEDVYSNL